MDAALAVVNPEAGGYDEDEIDAIVAALRDVGEVELVHTTSPRELERALEGLDGRRLVIAGGDGSLHAAAAALDRLALLDSTSVAVIPLGTGNDFAGGLGLASGLDAAEALAQGVEERTFDLVRTDDAIVVNAAHAGIGAVAAEKATTLKQVLGDAAYKAGALIAGVGAGPWRLTVTVDDRELWPEEGDAAVLVAIANGSSVGGGTALLPHARPDDGELDVLVSTATSPGERTGLGVALLRSEHDERPDVATARGHAVVVEGEAIPWNLDGELPGESTRRRFTIEPAALRLLVPRGG
ncbi:MAG: hypothetical protein KY469_18965 [Actinobacteria bacterium]|nr:hypothetical protein [Actinomycetota bacterium]